MSSDSKDLGLMWSNWASGVSCGPTDSRKSFEQLLICGPTCGSLAVSQLSFMFMKASSFEL